MTDQADRDPLPEAQVTETGRGNEGSPALPAYSVIQQQLINARDRLDREVSRLTRMHAFNAQALRLADDSEFVQAVAEAVVDIFELEFGICWLRNESGTVSEPIGVLGLRADEAELRLVGARLASYMGLTSGLQVTVLGPEVLVDVAPGLAVGQAICAHWPDAEGRASAVILGGNTTAGTRFFDAVTPQLSEAFGIFAQQVAALLENRQARATIERHMAELRRERGFLRSLIETLPDLVWLKDPEGMYLACNLRFERFFGARQEEILGKTDYDFVEKDLADFFRAKDRAAIAKGSPSVNEEWITFADDGHRELLETTKMPMFDAEHGLIGVLGIGHDLTGHKRIQAEITSARRQLQATLDAVPDLLFEFGSDGLIHDYHTSRKDLLAVPPEVFLGKTVAEVLPPDAAGIIMAALREAEESGRSVGKQYELQLPQGRSWFELSVSRKPVDPGEASRFIVLARDITAAKLSEAALRASEANYRELVANANVIILRMDLDGRVTYFNEFAQRFFGFSSAEILGRHVVGTIVPLRESETGRDLAEMIAAITADPARYSENENENVTRDGRRVFVRWANRIILDAQGRPTGVLAIGQDITAARKLEAELEQHRLHLEDQIQQRTIALIRTEAHASRILESAADGLYGVDTEGVITFINPAGCRMLGYRREQIIGRVAHSLFHHSKPDGSPYPIEECPTRTAIRTGQEIRVDSETYWHADGHPVPVMYAVHPTNQHGERSGAVVSFVDMSAQYAAAQAREQALVAAEALARARSEFLSNMSHEIRTPMNGVLGFAQIGYRNYKDSEKARNAFEKILASGNRLLGVVNEILDFSKIDAGKLTIDAVPMSLPEAIREAADLIAGSARAKGLDLRVELAPDLPPTCIGDPMRIGQVLLNLLSNAVKFTEKGSITLAGSRQASELVFRVSDTGIGMDAIQLGYAFDPFRQADGSATRKFGGTGLGLAICKRIAELMKGRICVQSAPGAGSSFEFRLPYVESRVAQTDYSGAVDAAREITSGKPLAGLSILIAEDDAINQMLLEVNLGDDGARLVTVGNGIEAVERVRVDGPEAYDLVLMDVQMPLMDGYAATRQILELAPGLPIIGQTAHAFGEDRDKCRAAGMVAYVAKPIDTRELTQLILDAVAKRKR